MSKRKTVKFKPRRPDPMTRNMLSAQRTNLSMSENFISKPYRFVRHLEASPIQNVCGAGPTPGATLGAMSLKLNQIPNYTEFTGLFDQYRIPWFKIEFIPCFNVNQAALFGTQVNQNAPFYTAIDYDDASPPASVSAIQQYANCERHELGKKFTVFVRPRNLMMIYESAIATSYALSPYGTWLDCASTAVPHYGLHYAISEVAQSAGTINLYFPVWTICIECKNAR